MSPAGFPHSEICGSRPICGSPQLIAAYHVLHRLLTPRHPPCALSSLTEHLVLDVSPYPSSSIQFSKIAKTRGAAVRPRGAKILYVSFEARLSAAISSGGDSRDRTGNLRLAKPALSQLSYIP
jgi:hypothetical protein